MQSTVQMSLCPPVLSRCPSSPVQMSFDVFFKPDCCLIVRPESRELPSPDLIASAQGPPQNPPKTHLQKRCPKEVQYDRRASQNDHKFMKNRARGRPNTIPDALLSNLVFERQYNEFHGFSGSGDSPNDPKSTQPDSKNRFETMCRKIPVQSTIGTKK